jgi:hypothetical protein
MQPFTAKTIQSILLFSIAFASSFYLLKDINGWLGMIFTTAIFSVQIILIIVWGKLTPDANQLLVKLKEKWKN